MSAPDSTSDENGGNEIISEIVPENLAGARIDKVIATLCPRFSRTRLKNLIEAGECGVNDAIMTDASYKAKAGDVITLELPSVVDAIPQPENIPIDIIFEDDQLLVINKAAGMVVHPAVGNESGTLVNAVLYHCGDTLSGINGVKRPGIVHRLDKDTTGLMIVAKTDAAHQALSAQLQDRSLSRIYHAVVFRAPFPSKGQIEFPIGRHPSNRLKMAVVHKGGRDALTYYDTLENFDDAVSYVECRLATGRTHQIRVHFEKIGHALIGDPVYGAQATALRAAMKKAGYDRELMEKIIAFPRPALHARKISFLHPLTGARMMFESDLPNDMTELLSDLDAALSS